MKRSINEIESESETTKRAKPSLIMDKIINNTGLQHIIEMIFLNLDYEYLQECQLLNKSIKEILENPMFWIKKWKGLSKESKKDWTKAIQITRNTNIEINVISYIKKAIKIGHVVDVPCYINANVVEKSNEFTLKSALKENNLGMVQILAPMVDNPNPRLLKNRCLKLSAIDIAAVKGYANMINILAPLIKNPNQPLQCDCSTAQPHSMTPLHLAAFYGKAEALKLLVTFTGNVNVVDTSLGRTPMHCAAYLGQIKILKFLAPLMENPNVPDYKGDTPIDRAKRHGKDEFVRILQSYIK